jgi:hypothetical protein
VRIHLRRIRDGVLDPLIVGVIVAVELKALVIEDWWILIDDRSCLPRVFNVLAR